MTLPPTIDHWWPVRGLGWFAARPWLWLRPLLAHAAALAVLISVATLVTWWAWPGAYPWWTWLWRAGAALSLGLSAALVTWALLVPVLLAVVLDSLAVAVFASQGVTVPTIPIAQAVMGSLTVLSRTLPLRGRWLAVSLFALVLGPGGPLLAAYALARVAVVDACDIALAVRGVPAADRLRLFAADRGWLRWSAVVAGGLQLGLGLTLLGWLFWMPGLVCGAALLASRPHVSKAIP
jgi:hypothetical protein